MSSKAKIEVEKRTVHKSFPPKTYFCLFQVSHGKIYSENFYSALQSVDLFTYENPLIIGISFFAVVLAMVVLSNLEPNTTYEIRVAAVNGKGQGDYSKIEIFQTLPVRKYSSLSCSLLSG